jgi:hypothetical protein
MKNTLLITASIVALVAGANLASAAEDNHGAPAATTEQKTTEQKAPEGKEQNATKHQKSDAAKPAVHAQAPDTKTPGKAGAKEGANEGAKEGANEGTKAGEPESAPKTSQKEDSQLPHKGVAPNATAQSRPASAPLSTEQHAKIRDMLRGEKTEHLATGEFSVSIGEAIPRTVHLYTLPTVLVESFPEYRDYDYILVGDEILIVDPGSLQIIAVIPA